MSFRKLKRNISRTAEGIRIFGIGTTIQGLFFLCCHGVFKPKVAFVKTRTDGLRIEFDYPSQMMPALVVFRDFLEPDYDFVRRILEVGFVFFDVGCGIGSYSMVAALKAPGLVHAFEPMRAGYNTIQKNLRANGLETRVKLNACGLSNWQGIGRMQEVENMFGSFVIPDGYQEESVAVQLTTLDAYCLDQSIDRIDVLKIDVEGHEPEVLKGASRMLAEGRIHVMIIEEDSHRASLYQEIMARGFCCGYFNPWTGQFEKLKVVDERTILSRKPSAFSSNLIFVQEQSMDWVMARLSAGLAHTR
jgi:FkbM family methyltransferase